MILNLSKNVSPRIFVSLLLLVGLSAGKVSSDEGSQQQGMVERKLISIISEPEDNRIHDLILDVQDNGDILRIMRRSGQDQTVFTPEDLLKHEVVLARASDRDAVLVSCTNCSSTYGGVLTLRYLYNGLFNTYNTFEMELERDGDFWALYTMVEKDENGKDKERVKIQTLRLRSRKIGDTLIGIRKIDVNR